MNRPGNKGSAGPSATEARLLPRDARAVAGLLSNHLDYPHLKEPLGTFLAEIASVATCRGVALAIEDYAGTGRYLVIHALVDLGALLDDRPTRRSPTAGVDRAFTHMARSLKSAPFRLALKYRHMEAVSASDVEADIRQQGDSFSDAELLLGADSPQNVEFVQVVLVAEDSRGGANTAAMCRACWTGSDL